MAKFMLTVKHQLPLIRGGIHEAGEIIELDPENDAHADMVSDDMVPQDREAALMLVEVQKDRKEPAWTKARADALFPAVAKPALVEKQKEA